MKIQHYHDVAANEEVPGVFKRDVIAPQDGAPRFCMRVFEVEPGSSTPFHEHWWEHEVYILAGQGEAVSENGSTQVAEGSVVFVSPEEKHCFKNTGKNTLRFICMIPKLS
jgi:quercetin dioxygenase-like cupin family protein